MNTFKELNRVSELLERDLRNSRAYNKWYRDAIRWILKDIRNSETISVESIEKYLKDLTK